MPKRFTDTDKWRNPWFRKLSPVYKALWLYIVDSCDNAGVWMVDGELASFSVGEQLDLSDALTAFGGRVEPLGDGKRWHVVDFVEFQFGKLSDVSKLHIHIRTLQYKHGIGEANQWVSNGYPMGMDTHQDKDIYKDKDKVKRGSVRGSKISAIPTETSDFDLFWHSYDRKVDRQRCLKLWAATTPDERAAILEHVPRYVKSTPDPNFRRHPATYLNQRSWENAIAPPVLARGDVFKGQGIASPDPWHSSNLASFYDPDYGQHNLPRSWTREQKIEHLKNKYGEKATSKATPDIIATAKKAFDELSNKDPT